MKLSYEKSNQGWNPRFKKRELLSDPEMKYLLFFNQVNDDPVSFISFRFDLEENIYDQFDTVVYCYEVQIDEKYRSLGLGKFMMDIIEQLGIEWKMEKLMLTVFTFNTRAIQFYETIGFKVDPESPNYNSNSNDEIEEDYQIMSKLLQ